MIDTDLIDEVVCDIYEQSGINRLGFNSIEVAKKLGIKVIEYSYIKEKSKSYYEALIKKSKDGFSLICGNTPIICYNDEIKPSGRIVQTINHEIGHIALNHHDLRKDLPSGQKEKEANLFASKFYEPFVLMTDQGITTVEEIMETFHITKTNAEIQQDRFINNFMYRGYVCGYSEYDWRLLDIFSKNQQKYELKASYY